MLTNPNDVILGATPTYEIANRFEMFYIPTDTVNSCYYNKFADITETDNKIYLTSINYSVISTWDSLNDAYLMDIYSFDKQTRQQQIGRISLPTPVHQAFGVKTTQVYEDEIAIVFNSCFNAQNQCTYALRVHPQENGDFEIFNISIFDVIPRKFKLYDCEYLTEENELVVLKKSIFNGDKLDMVFHLDMNKNVQFPYDSYKYNINHKNNIEFLYNDLVASEKGDYVVSGYSNENKMLIYDTKNTAYLHDDLCFQREIFQVTNINSFTTIAIPQLTQCHFSDQVLDISNNQYNILYLSKIFYNAIIKHHPLPNKVYGSLNKSCLK